MVIIKNFEGILTLRGIVVLNQKIDIISKQKISLDDFQSKLEFHPPCVLVMQSNGRYYG